MSVCAACRWQGGKKLRTCCSQVQLLKDKLSKISLCRAAVEEYGSYGRVSAEECREVIWDFSPIQNLFV